MSDVTVEFRVLVAMFEAMQRSKSAAEKRKKLRKFLDHCYYSRRFFSAIRLILPALDRERGSYGLKESVLATCLIDALGMSRESEDALRLVNWRKGGPQSGANAGNFSMVAAEVLQCRQGMTSGGLSIKELNDLLDQLASRDNRGQKTSVLAELIKKTNTREMKWILMIILKDLKLGISEKSIFNEFHPDAEDLFNVTCDLKLVCEKLNDRTQRHKRQDIEVGKAVRPQLALRVSDASSAWKKLHGKEVVIECKFDGDRIQIHRDIEKLHFFSRNFFDHPEYEHSMSKIILDNILVDRCILDGEMLVWDSSANRFAEFGSNQEIAKAAKDGLESNRQLCYVAFDILYAGDSSVIHQTLKERHVLLHKVVSPVKGRLEILVPDEGLNVRHCPGEPCWSTKAYKMEDVQRFFKEMIDNRDEGIVLKDLNSKWEPGDRSGKWLKLKPDYIHPASDLDVLIIGGYFGSGRRGGEVAQFLLGLVEHSADNSYPKRFVSFCRVGTGLSDDELDTLVLKLRPNFRKNEYPKKAPSYYEVTNNSKERPDVWIDNPEKSVILSVTSDIRTIKSTVFAAPYSLRFPRIDRVRYDKAWYECLDVKSFVDLVRANNGNAQSGKGNGDSQTTKSQRIRMPNKGVRRSAALVPRHLILTDVSDVKKTTGIFSNMIFYFVNTPPSYHVEHFHKLVVANGGNFSMNLNDSVTHCIAAEKKGIKYEAAILHGDVIHCSWILDCCAQRRLLHLQPKYFLFHAKLSKNKLQDEMDEYSDSYYLNIDASDARQLLCDADMSVDYKAVGHYKRKYCPLEQYAIFQDCYIYFHSVVIMDPDFSCLGELTVKRMKLEVSMRGGEISDDLSCVTHLVIFSTSRVKMKFETILRSFPVAKRHFLYKNDLQILDCQWLDDALCKGSITRAEAKHYSLKPENLEEWQMNHCGADPASQLLTSGWGHQTSQSGRKRKGDELVYTKGKIRHTHVKRTTKRGQGSAKIDSSVSEDDTGNGISKKEAKLDSKSGGTSGIMGEGERLVHTKGKPRHTIVKRRTERGHCSAKIDSGVSEEDPGNEIRRKKDKLVTKSVGTLGIMGESGRPMRETTVDAEMAAPGSYGQKFDSEDGETVCTKGTHGTEKGYAEKLEVMIDPVQTMLLDMVPSLGGKIFDTQGTVQSTQKILAQDHTKLEEPIMYAEPVKKKVSYKNVASQLLEDW